VQVHRDITSGNVLLTAVDAGGAKQAGRLRAKARAPGSTVPAWNVRGLPAEWQATAQAARRAAHGSSTSRDAAWLHTGGRPRAVPAAAGRGAEPSEGRELCYLTTLDTARLRAGGGLRAVPAAAGRPAVRHVRAARHAGVPAARAAGERRGQPGRGLLRIRRPAVGDVDRAGAPPLAGRS